MTVLVERVLYVGAGNEQLEWVIHIRIVQPLGLHALHLLHALLLMRAEPQLLLVAPQDGRLDTQVLLGQDVVKVDNLVASPISDDDEDAALVAVEAIVEAGLDA